jgi:hypothetical protein
MLGSLRNKIPHIVAVFLALLVCALFWVEANGKDLEIKSTVNKDSITIGDEIVYSLVIQSRPGINLDSIKLDLNLSSFQVKQHKNYPLAKDKDGNTLQKQDYVITVFDLGDFVILPVKAECKDSQNQLAQASSDSISIKVRSIGLPQEAKDIKGLKPPFKIKEKSKWYLYVLLVIAAGSILTWLYLRWKSKGIGLPQVQLEKEKPAWQIALASLEELKDSDYIQKQEIKKYYIILSEIIRKYLEGGFNVPAVDRTTSEIKWEMKKIKIEQEIIQRVVDLLSECDLVKFAKFVPSVEQTDENWQESHDLVQQTKPEEVQPIEVAK